MRAHWIVLGLILVPVLRVQGAAPPGESDPPALCLRDLVPSVSVSPSVINFGQAVTLSWSVSVPGPCPGIQWTLAGPEIFDGAVGAAGSRVLHPAESATYTLTARLGDRSRLLGSPSVVVAAPPPLPTVDGRPNVAIISNAQVGLFLQAIGTRNAIVRIANDVQLDLSGRSSLDIKPGVQIIGGRSSTERGPKLYTRTFPRKLFRVGVDEPGDNVRITGLRIEGAEMGIASDTSEASDGITVYSSKNVEIDNNEIYGWRGSAVEVRDGMPGRENALPRANDIGGFEVRVQDNFIHHNQRYDSLGYGVSVHDGAYVLIARNVFDYNRHAIAAGGGAPNGYWAQSNLVLEHGGVNATYAGVDQNTHMFDVHGTRDCCFGAGLYCGEAGEQFWFKSNTFLYDAGTAIKLRGKPALLSVAEFNVFRHGPEWGGCVYDGPFAQTDPSGNFVVRNNEFRHFWNEMLASTRCDFNADGMPDSFIATGATWWYYSPRLESWRHLRDSSRHMSDLTLGRFNEDPYCDVRDSDGAVYLSPPGPELQGLRVKAPDDPAIHLVLDGKRHLIPDAATYANVFRDASGILTLDLSVIPDGGPLLEARLARTVSRPHVYLVANGRKHWITSDQAIDFFHFDRSQVDIVPDAALDYMARDGDLAVSPLGTARAVVPDVVGQQLLDATAALMAAGFVRGALSLTIDCDNIGVVMGQSPSAGTLNTVGMPVNLAVGRRPPPRIQCE
jgi:hypothetical protein